MDLSCKHTGRIPNNMEDGIVYEIEKNVPIPKPQVVGRPSKYPFEKMDVGDSFFVENQKHESVYKLSVTISQATRRSRLKGKRFTVRQLDGGVRVWRTA